MPYETLPMTIVDGAAYNGATGRARSHMLPPTAGVYIWTLQLSRILDGMTSGSELPNRMQAAFEDLRSKKFEVGQAGHFRRVHVYDSPPDLKDTSVARIDALLDGGFADFSWLLALGTLFQRPLYVGKAINFRTRLPAHFGYRTSFAKSIDKFGLTFNDLAVTLVLLSPEGLIVPAQDDIDGILDEQDEASDVAERLSEDSLDDEDLVEAVPPGREQQDRLIRLAESLLIRNLQPIFNKQVE